MSEIRLEYIQWLAEHPLSYSDGKPVYPEDIVGFVSYEITHLPGQGCDYIHQPFRAGTNYVYKDIDGKDRNIWAWDGDREKPTLSPSIACDFPANTRTGRQAFRIHLNLTKGAIVLHGDSAGVIVGAEKS